MKQLYEETSRRKTKYVPSMEIGEEIDFLTLIAYDTSTDCGHRRGIFKCVCGKEVSRIIYQMKKKAVSPRSCGCKTIWERNAKPKKGFDGDLANKFIMGRL